MRARRLSELFRLMQPAVAEVEGDADVVVGPDVVIDNRNATKGSLFVAIPGERVDGHQFAPAAVEAGAAAVLGTRVTDAHVPHLICDNSVAGLSALARGLVAEARARGMVSIGITGSSGKTSTKDLLAQVLERAGETVSPVGSQNNEIGVPLTACRVDDDTRFLVSEMGARGIGHIAWLISLVGVDVGVVLNVGMAHVGEFGGVDHTARAKSEMVDRLDPEGWAVLNADDPNVSSMALVTKARIAWFGEGDVPDGELAVRAKNVTTNALSQPSFDLEVSHYGHWHRERVELKLIGRHQVSNALAAAAAAIAAGADFAVVAEALSEAQQRSDWRMDLRRRSDGVLVLNDSYNANPDSVAAALRTAVELGQYQRAEGGPGRVIAVLGDMLELGFMASEQHAAIGQLAADLEVDEVIAVGELADHVVRAAVDAGIAGRVAKREEIAASLDLRPGDVVLIKGSRGIGLQTVAAALLEGEPT